MPIKFDPKYTINPRLMKALMSIEACKQAIIDLPITPSVLMHLRQTARLFSTHYSTQIEGNRLTQAEVNQVLELQSHFPGRERDEQEVKGYYAALAYVEELVAKAEPVSEKVIQQLHAFVMGEGRSKVKPTEYRDGQNVIRDSLSGRIVYMPPEAKEVAALMQVMVQWIQAREDIPCPIVASIAHYQFATIHPYYDGNGRTARLLTTLILHLGGYDLHGIYCLEEYYATNLAAYYKAISVDPSHNYYMGRAEADITEWMEYFCEGMAESFSKIKLQAQQAAQSGEQDKSALLRELEPRQRKVLELFLKNKTVTAKQLGALFGFKPRTSSALCQRWVKENFLVIVDASRKTRSYRLAEKYEALLNPRRLRRKLER